MTRQLHAPRYVNEHSTDADKLRHDYGRAIIRLNAAYDAVQALRARPEDYATRIAYSQAMTEHHDRLERIHAVATELQAIAAALEAGEASAEIVD